MDANDGSIEDTLEVQLKVDANDESTEDTLEVPSKVVLDDEFQLLAVKQQNSQVHNHHYSDR